MAAPASPDEYTIGWIAALYIERAAATALLDEQFDEPEEFEPHPSDPNSYTWGRMGKHNIVIAALPAGVYGVTSAATTASGLLASLPQIKIGLLVGIGGGIARPDLGFDIRLGDVAVSEPAGQSGGVVQYDLGKAKLNDEWERKGSLDSPPKVLLTALGSLRAAHEMKPPKIPELLDAMWTASPQSRSAAKPELRYVHQGVENDRLFLPAYGHATEGPTCDGCDASQEVKRDVRETTNPAIHYGIIASGNRLVKDAAARDEIVTLVGKECICLEMEAAGLMNHFPCLVIRGICDYADSHKNDRWQRYAAATAAAYTKELLSYVSPKQLHKTDRAASLASMKKSLERIESTTTDTLAVSQAIQQDASKLPKIESAVDSLQTTEQREQTERITDWLAPIVFSTVQKRVHKAVQPGTGQWFLNCDAFQDWVATAGATLWCPGIAGAGKTTLMSLAIAYLLQRTQGLSDVKVACAYCEYKEQETHDPTNIVAGLWRQLVDPNDQHTEDVQKLWDDHQHGAARVTEKGLADVIKIVKAAIERNSQTFLLVDALDELPEDNRLKLVEILRSLQASKKCNILITSRRYTTITKLFQDDPTLEMSAQWDDLHTYIKARMQAAAFREIRTKIPTLEDDIVETVIPNCEKIFQLATLYMDFLATKLTVNEFKTAMRNLPKGLDSMYETALGRIKQDQLHAERAMQVLFWVAFATRPLSANELKHALAIKPGEKEYDENNELLKDITSICAALVVVDPQSSIVRLAHFTIDEYLKAKHDKWFPGVLEHLTSHMLTYLSFDSFQQPLRDGHTIEEICDMFPLLEYATMNWANHLNEASSSSDKVKQQALEFLHRDFRLSDLITKRHVGDLLQRHRFGGEVSGNITSLHLAVLFRLDSFVPHLQEREQERPTKNPLAASPLNIACKLDRVSMAEALLDAGADVHGTPGFAWRPIHQAAIDGKNADMVALLLKRGANIKARVNHDAGDDTSYNWVRGQSPLLEAAWIDNIETAKALLQNGADMFEAASSYVDTPFATCHKGSAVFAHFLRTLTEAQIADKRVVQPLMKAQSVDLLKYMIQRGFDVNLPCNDGKRPLDHAIETGDVDMVAFLLENGAQPGHGWVTSEDVSRSFSSQPWFPRLEQALSRCESNLRGRPGQSHRFDANTWHPPLRITTNHPVAPQVQVSIDDSVDLPVQAIAFRMDSHDQGWSDGEWAKGTYEWSYTWFEMRVKYPRSDDNDDERTSDEYSETIRVQLNLSATATWKKHIHIWDRDCAAPDIVRILDLIGRGCTVEFLPRAQYPGWMNYVRHMRVDVYGRIPEEETTAK